MDVRMLHRRLNVASLPVIAMLATLIGALTFSAGFPSWVAAIVGTVTAAVGCWTVGER